MRGDTVYQIIGSLLTARVNNLWKVKFTMTVQEIEAKRVKLEAELTTALEAAKVLTPATAEFDDAYGRYLAAKANIAKIPAEIAAAMKAEHANAIKADCVTLAESIRQLIDGLGIKAKLGEPVISVVWTQGATGIDGVVPAPVVHINPTVKARSASGTREPKVGGRTLIKAPDGTTQSLTKFVLEHITEAEKLTPEYKYPHAQVSSRPKFMAFCEAHGLTGYEYITPDKSGGEAS